MNTVQPSVVSGYKATTTTTTTTTIMAFSLYSLYAAQREIIELIDE
jgi:hypothetical protein